MCNRVEEDDGNGLVKVGMESENQFESCRRLISESERARDITRSSVSNVRKDDTVLGGDLAVIGELSRREVCHHQRSQWKVVHLVEDPE